MPREQAEASRCLLEVAVPMRIKNWLLPTFLFLACSAVPAYSLQASSPQEALEELATAENLAAVIKHLPLKVQEQIEKLPAQGKAAMADKLVIKKSLEREGGKLTRTDDGSGWELVELEVKDRGYSESVMIGMRFEHDEWRVTNIGHWRETDLEAELLARIEAQEAPGETAAVSTLRTLHTALISYATSYPEVGYPTALQALSGQEDQEASAQHAMLLDSAFMAVPAIKDGYEFRYTLINSGNVSINEGRYQITATPVEFGKTGSKSFFTDQNTVIRAITGPRPANENDPPLQ